MNPGGIKDHGGAAFPLHSEIRPSMDKDWCGMTLRDYFAAKALPVAFEHCGTHKSAAEESYKMADAMLEAREA